MNNIPTPHIEATSKDAFAKTVLMPGDPLRAKYIAENYLENVKIVNSVRNMLAYTGTYHGKKVTVMGSGMGMPSIGIYSYELFAFYGVENIIRIGSCGSYSEKADIYDVICVLDAYSDSTFGKSAFSYRENIIPASLSLVCELRKSAESLRVPLIAGRIYSSDVFYRSFDILKSDVVLKYGCIGVEMESFALFMNARYLKKKAACLLTVSDSLISGRATSSKEREVAFDNMIKIALNAI